MHIDFDFVILNLILLLIYYYAGYNVSKGQKFWPNAITCLVAFTFVMGSRYARGPDYFNYMFLYENHIEEHGQFGFSLLNLFLFDLGVNKYAIFYVYAMISMLGGLFFLKKYKLYCQYLFPLFLMATYWIYQNPVRQGLSFAFVFLFMLQLFNIRLTKFSDFFCTKNYKTAAIAFVYFFMSSSIHTANLYIAIVFIALYFLLRFPVPVFISWPMVVFFTYVMPNIYNYSMISPLFSSMTGQTELADVWIGRGEQFFSEDSFRDEYVINPTVELLRLLSYFSVLYFGHKVLLLRRLDQGSVTIFNFVFLGMLVLSGFRLVELFARIGFFMYVLWFYPVATILYYRKSLLKKSYERILFFAMFFVFYDYFKYLFMNEGGTLFLWDANI